MVIIYAFVHGRGRRVYLAATIPFVMHYDVTNYLYFIMHAYRLTSVVCKTVKTNLTQQLYMCRANIIDVADFIISKYFYSYNYWFYVVNDVFEKY